MLDFVREARFERLGAFTYSEEEGTWGAEHLRDDVPAEVKQERLDRLMELQRGISLACNQARVGTECLVMVDDIPAGAESFRTGGPELAVCRSEFESPEVDGEILLRHPSPDLKVGDMVRVRIVAAEDYDLIAEAL